MIIKNHNNRLETHFYPLVCKWIFFMKKVLLNRLFTSGTYRGGTDYTQLVNYSQITQ